MITITNIILKLEHIIKKSVVTSHILISAVTFSRINFSANTAFIRSNLNQFQKESHQDNLSFVYLQIYKHNCLNKLPSNIYFRIQIKNQ